MLLEKKEIGIKKISDFDGKRVAGDFADKNATTIN